MPVPPSEESHEASRGDRLVQSWDLEDGGGLCPDKGSPLPACSMSRSAGIPPFSMQFRWVLWASRSRHTEKKKHPSGALHSSQNLISAQPEGGWAALTLCGRDRGSDCRSSELPVLPAHHTGSLPSPVAPILPPPTPGLSLPLPLLPQRLQTLWNHQQSMCVYCVPGIL